MKGCEDIVEISNWLKNECIIHNLPCIDMTYNRDAIINKFINKLEC